MKDNEFPWINSEVNLFDMTIGVPLWLKDISVSEVKWLKDDPRKGVKAVVTLWEPLRDSSFLLRLTEDSKLTFDLTRQENGPRDVYSSDVVVASMTDCEILSKWVEDLVIIAPSEAGVVGVLLQMRVSFKLILKGAKP